MTHSPKLLRYVGYTTLFSLFFWLKGYLYFVDTVTSQDLIWQILVSSCMVVGMVAIYLLHAIIATVIKEINL